ncbi:MAG: DNA polymerase III subunit delta [Geminocystis sp.]|nr:DNA polymerase III subunit delta [Geminocystis sp.]HIK37557.1 DNA polymerase III subunit delta [Geminocystis sp. M7585_C2015_104]MCS7146711.1 DNA polymerase III subunit delta [Geminocystis sp.]MCX8077139.1 DNA polymerase III subunit delta [Geminocystis sp.]MDW8115537.1 DNA polymerase III subunit delta [Geminocystis sp.]
MPIYYFWGDDDFAIQQEIMSLKETYLDSEWLQFNWGRFPGDKRESLLEGIYLAMTPPFGGSHRLVWIYNTTLFQENAEEELVAKMQKYLKQIPETTHLIFTATKKPDSRLKIGKLITQNAQVKEFSIIPPWQTEKLVKRVEELAAKKGIKLSKEAINILANSVGNDTRSLWQELEKLSIYQGDDCQTMGEGVVESLVNISGQNSIQLAQATLRGDNHSALLKVEDLINNQNENPLKIVATMVGQFRTWCIVKAMTESGEDENTIAEYGEIGNPKRVYFLRQEVKNISLFRLKECLEILLEVEYDLKIGKDPVDTLKTAVIKMCNL